MKTPYAYIAVEGNIGAGKTTFARLAAEVLDSQLLLERFEENPFLERFYEDPVGQAFPVELAFVADRFRQLRESLGARNLFRQIVVADYSFDKSLIFARANLDPTEFKLFRTMFRLMEKQLPRPEVVAILDPTRSRIREQINKRGRSYEKDLADTYLDKIAFGYHKHFQYSRGSRVLWIDTSDYDMLARPADAEKLLEHILEPRTPGIYSL